MAKLFKIEMYVVDYNSIFEDFTKSEMKEEIKTAIESFSDVSIEIAEIKEKDIGEWNDKHKLNKINLPIEEFKKEFGEVK